jgi:uncharacterized protein (TIGR03435 family)
MHLLLLSILSLFFLPATAQAPSSPTFEVASVRPAPPGTDPSSGSWNPPNHDRFTATHVTLARLILLAYGVDSSQVVNKPGWFDTNLYDVEARSEAGIQLSRDDLKPRLQNLLHDRFHLIAHIEMRPSRGYALVVAKSGPHLVPTKAEHWAGFRIDVNPGQMRGANWSMPILAQYLTAAAGFPVVDQTGLAGSYDIAFSYDPDLTTDSDLPSLNEALKQATGLMLKEQKVQVETIVIDSADKVPTEN